MSITTSGSVISQNDRCEENKPIQTQKWIKAPPNAYVDNELLFLFTFQGKYVFFSTASWNSILVVEPACKLSQRKVSFLLLIK